MKIIDPSYEIITDISNGHEILSLLERAGRTCYKSEDKITPDSCVNFVNNLKQRGHHAMLEHFNITVKFICNRGFTHELVRHRLASYAQESTRYCNYGKANEITVIRPAWYNTLGNDCNVIWEVAMENAEKRYLDLISKGMKPQDARGVLPIDLKTEIVITTNIREWMHIFNMRCSKEAHPSMRQLMIPLRNEFRNNIPVIFDEGVVE